MLPALAFHAGPQASSITGQLGLMTIRVPPRARGGHLPTLVSGHLVYRLNVSPLDELRPLSLSISCCTTSRRSRSLRTVPCTTTCTWLCTCPPSEPPRAGLRRGLPPDATTPASRSEAAPARLELASIPLAIPAETYVPISWNRREGLCMPRADFIAFSIALAIL